MENEDIYIPENGGLTVDDEGTEDAETHVTERLSDISVMQAVICLAAAAALTAYIHYAPEAGNRLLSEIRKLSASPAELFTNPLILLLERLGV